MKADSFRALSNPIVGWGFSRLSSSALATWVFRRKKKDEVNNTCREIGSNGGGVPLVHGLGKEHFVETVLVDSTQLRFRHAASSSNEKTDEKVDSK